MYQEIKTDELAAIFSAVECALSKEGRITLTLDKRDNDYVATLVQVDSEPESPT